MKCQICQEAEATHTSIKVDVKSGQALIKLGACLKCGLLKSHGHSTTSAQWRLYGGAPIAPLPMDREDMGLEPVVHVPGQLSFI